MLNSFNFQPDMPGFEMLFFFSKFSACLIVSNFLIKKIWQKSVSDFVCQLSACALNFENGVVVTCALVNMEKSLYENCFISVLKQLSESNIHFVWQFIKIIGRQLSEISLLWHIEPARKAMCSY